MLLFLPSVVPDSFDYKTLLAVASGRIQSKIWLDTDLDRIHRFWIRPDPQKLPDIRPDPDLDPVHQG